MIIKRPEMKTEVREQMRGGPGAVSILQHVPAAAMHGLGRLCATLVLPPGAGIGFHEHAAEYEIFIIQKGQALVDDNGDRRELGPGDAVITGGGAGHAVTNIGDGPLEMTAVILTGKAD